MGKVLALLSISILLLLPRCSLLDFRTVPREGRFGIYLLDIGSGDVELVWSCEERLTGLALNPAGDRFAVARRCDGDRLVHEEVCVVGADGTGYARLTSNDIVDTYPVWSPDGTRILYLSWPDSTLDMWMMEASGRNKRLFYDSGQHDADPSWVGHRIAFTKGSKVWTMRDDGTSLTKLTDPPNAGKMGNAVLPFGDYDPRLSPDGSKIVFERLLSDLSFHGYYDLFAVGVDGTGLTRLTWTLHTQGMGNWSSDGQKVVFVVSAIMDEGKYDIWLMNYNGSYNHDITPGYFPAEFLCHAPLFAPGDDKVYFIGEWWEEETGD